MTDESQGVVWEADYTPFGEAVIVTETVSSNLRLPGQYYDFETGLYYNYFRYYDPSTGRYMTSDPIGLDGGINTYGYVGGNPLYWVDPFGLDFRDWYVDNVGGFTDFIVNHSDEIDSGWWDFFAQDFIDSGHNLSNGKYGAATFSFACGIIKPLKLGKKATKSAKEAAKAQFRKEAAGLEAKVIRSGRDGTGKILGVGTKGRGGPTYRPKSDGSYSVGKRGDVKHYRPTPEGGHTVNQR